MKILVFSDSHGDEQGIVDVIEENKDVNAIVFLGDGERDFEAALAACNIAPYGGNDSIRTFQVRGNCDRFSMEPLSVTAELGGVRFFITHGHDQNVKSGVARLAQTARGKQCDAALFGHTHLQCLEEKDGLILLNPGSIRSGKYAVITVKDGRAEYRLKRLPF